MVILSVKSFFFLVKLSSNARKRRKKREQNGTQIHPPLVIPSQRRKTLAKSRVSIFDRHMKKEMILPCFYQFSCVLFFDSIGKYFTSNLIPDMGYTVSSFSGMDLLDLMILFSYGRLYLNRSDSDPIVYQNRKSFGIRNAPIPQHNNCRTCNMDCAKFFNGVLCIGVSLNNSLKANQKSFSEQNIGNLFTLLECKIKTKFPRIKQVIWIRPLRPIRYDWVNSELSRMTFAKISEVLDTKTYVIGDSEFAKSRSGHSFDGIHLKPYFAEHYYRVILTKFSDQCLISIDQ